ncbi:hypothetical protein TVAG_333990 [Trichomonas vaginalis G3]|uniref:Uncharacterized protein n=1 Tax=Trichomonas vaginalis (strain ATCC PRA-98 / G3) TaxID=412133 RepID=A2EIA5_TRIV3|nr:hypothetical protein TVAGG3_0060260 [Trichomonas vaginalis G3]EAY07587.1 hypothetical protein TVAG_333990 [Trichomonas vaginalis G3]KAI5541951.1 hypothetical protein TVAGG3_0060260 [Trichomonas vaginalis G3]|eukprot:XP_001319810.1 hypothetical protein [Trichomonas vaginalis G3]
MTYLSTIGDSFWNSCRKVENYEKNFKDIFSYFLRWTEPHIVVELCLVILAILPLIFKTRSTESYVKISRLYNVSRLSILTLFHRILYIYVIIIPLGYLLGKPPPCTAIRIGYSAAFYRLYTFPFPKLSSLLLILFYVGSLITISKPWANIVIHLIALFFTTHFIIVGDASISQALFTFSLVYILNFYSQRVRLSVLHIENAAFIILISVLFSLKGNSLLSEEKIDFTGRMISAITLLVIDEYMLIRYQYTRYGYASVGRPIDIGLETGSNEEGKYFSVLSSEEEIAFSKNLINDIFDSFVATFFFLIGLYIRHQITGVIKPSLHGLL